MPLKYVEYHILYNFGKQKSVRYVDIKIFSSLNDYLCTLMYLLNDFPLSVFMCEKSNLNASLIFEDV